jgi:hypothetical protein
MRWGALADIDALGTIRTFAWSISTSATLKARWPGTVPTTQASNRPENTPNAGLWRSYGARSRRVTYSGKVRILSNPRPPQRFTHILRGARSARSEGQNDEAIR